MRLCAWRKRCELCCDSVCLLYSSLHTFVCLLFAMFVPCQPFLLFCRPLVDSETTPTCRLPSLKENGEENCETFLLEDCSSITRRDDKRKKVSIASYFDLVVELETASSRLCKAESPSIPGSFSFLRSTQKYHCWSFSYWVVQFLHLAAISALRDLCSKLLISVSYQSWPSLWDLVQRRWTSTPQQKTVISFSTQRVQR